MSLQDLVQEIQKEAEAQIAKLNEEAGSAIYEIQKDYEKKRGQRKLEIEKKTQENIDTIEKRAETFANMEVKNHLLGQKRTLLTDVFNEIIKTLAESKDYEKTLVTLLKKLKKHFKIGTVVAARGKEDATAKAIKEAGVDYKVAAHSAHIAGGFIFKSEDTEVDFSFESILEKELWGNLEMKLSKLLF